MVAHGGLGQAKWGREVADACLAVGARTDETQEAQPSGVRENTKRTGEPLRLVLAERSGENLRTTLRIDDDDLSHDFILTNVDASVNVSTFIDGRKGDRP
jgi:hypothetical protein